MEVIDRFEDAHRFLSNFAPSRIVWCGREWPTVEHAYQAAKNYDPDRWVPLDEAAVEEIRTAPTPNKAKKLGRKIKLAEGWDEPFGDDEEEPRKRWIMRELLRIKFEDPTLRDALLGTGNAKLVEGNWWGDKVWGVCDGEGKNWLGLELMALRTALRNEHEFPKPRCCEAIQKFPLVYAKAEGTWTWDEDERVTGTAIVAEPLRIRWCFARPSVAFFEEFGYQRGYGDGMPEPKTCPFCSTPLPEFRERDPLPEPMCRSNEYYCLTCDERLMGCRCLAPQLRWEIVE